MILRDYRCAACGNLQEEFAAEPCEACGGVTVEEFSYAPSSGLNIEMWSVFTKGSVIRQKLQNRLPWRKNSWSQTD